MISRIESKRLTSQRKMILYILSFGLLFLVLVGNGFAQQDDDENTGLISQFLKKKSSSSSTNSSSSSGNSLFPSSWFRKSDTVKSDTAQNNTKNNTPNRKPVTAKPVTVASAKEPNAEHAPATSKILDDFSSDDLNLAPLPPEHPYYEKNRAATAAGMNRQSVSISESAQLPMTDTVPNHQFHQETPRTSDEPMVTGLSSYSFDTRDWVESFPIEHVSGLDGYSSNQAMPLNVDHNVQTVAMNDPIPVRQNISTASPVSASQWDGQTTPIPSKSPKLASANRSILDNTKKRETPTSKSKFDLSPSYTSWLKYSEVYGVVVVQSNFPLTEIKSILEEIEQLQVDLNLYMGVPAPKEKIELCLFRDEKSYLKFLQEVFPKAPRDRRALYIKIDNEPGTLLVQKTDEFEVDLRHEMTHAIIHTSIANVPIWLDEGLAKYFEVPINDRATNNPYMKQIRWNTQFGAVPSLTRLEKLEHIGQMGVREYRDSWAWVHFLIHNSPQTHRLLAGYLQHLSTLPTEVAKEQDSVQIPPISPFLENVVQNPREKYREHFQNNKTAK